MGADERPPTGPTASPESGSALCEQLSDREKQVVALLVDGLSMAQVGRRLFISPSTVSFHLGRIYAKTGINSRHRLTAALRGEPA